MKQRYKLLINQVFFKKIQNAILSILENRLYSRPGNDFTRRFLLIVETLVRLRSRSCIIDGEAVVCDDKPRR
jgi:ATP-dependent DNA ligase